MEELVQFSAAPTVAANFSFGKKLTAKYISRHLTKLQYDNVISYYYNSDIQR